jgi:hypothetical protein
VTRRLTSLLFLDGVVDALAQGVRDMVFAAVGDHLTEVGLEVEGTEARGALVEMFLDLGPALIGELAVEIVVEPLDGLVAIDLGTLGSHLAFSHQPRG